MLWNDVVSLDPVSSARRFINVFFVDQEANVEESVVAVRLPYDRVNITGTDPFTFSSNDVVSSPKKVRRTHARFSEGPLACSEGFQSHTRP